MAAAKTKKKAGTRRPATRKKRGKRRPPSRVRGRNRWLALLAMVLLSLLLIWGVVSIAGNARGRRAPAQLPSAASQEPEISEQERQKLRRVLESIDGQPKQ